MGWDPDLTVAVQSLAPVVAQLHRGGVDVDAYLREVGLDPAVLADRTARVPLSVAGMATHRAIEISGDPCFGLHAGEHVDERALDLVGYIPIAQRTVGGAMASVARYFRLLGDIRTIRLDVNGPDAAFSTHLHIPAPPDIQRHGAEMVLAINHVLANRSAEVGFRTREVRFAHPAPPQTAEHERVFGCPVRFDAGEDAMIFDSAQLEVPLRTRDPALAAILTAAAEEALARLPQTATLASEVRRRLPELLAGGTPGLDDVAKSLGLSGRTLQRRLRDEGTSHSEILDDVRRELAEGYLAGGRMSAAEVAFLLGFSEPASFHRAFKRWTGTTPAKHRERFD